MLSKNMRVIPLTNHHQFSKVQPHRAWNARIFPHSTSDKLLPLGLLITLGTQLFDETLNPTLIMTLYRD